MPVARILAAYLVSLGGGTVIYCLLSLLFILPPISQSSIGTFAQFLGLSYLIALIFFTIPFLIVRLIWFRKGWNSLPAAIAGSCIFGVILILFLTLMLGVSLADGSVFFLSACIMPAAMVGGWIQWLMEESFRQHGKPRESSLSITKASS